MRLLLDTHIAIWLTYDSRRVPPRARQLIDDTANRCFVSVVTIWEIAIKHQLRRGSQPAIAISGKQAHQAFTAIGLRMLGVSIAHAEAVDALPRHHGDPFDRLLVAQALSEPLRLVTADVALAAYGEIVIVV